MNEKTKIFMVRLGIVAGLLVFLAASMFATIVTFGKMFSYETLWCILFILSFGVTMLIGMATLHMIFITLWDMFPKMRKFLKRIR